VRGAAYGLRQSLDTIGAFAGPLLAVFFMALFAGDIRAVFWVAVIPAFIAVALLIVGIQEPERPVASHPVRMPIHIAHLARLGSAYWWVVLVGAVLTLARFSEAFLVLRVEKLGLSMTFVPMVLVVMSAVYAASAYPAGRLSDVVDRRFVLALGFVVLILADLLLATAGGVWMAMIGVALWGLHMGLTQGLFATLIADSAPADLRGTAFGVFHLASGVMLLAASVFAGWLWDRHGAPTTFFAGAAFTALALVGILLRPSAGKACP
jgi:MFS family permease